MRWLLGTAAIALAGALCACGTNNGASPGEQQRATGTVHLELNGASLATIVVRDVFDHSQNFLVDCTLKDHLLDGGQFCDELLVLPPGVYEIRVQSQDPTCQTELDHYKVVVTAGQTTEQVINLLCGPQNGAVDVVITTTAGQPEVRDLEFSFASTGQAANKFICQNGDNVNATLTVVDPDTSCPVLFASAQWRVNGSTTLNPPIVGESFQTGPGGDCLFGVTLDSNAPGPDYNLTLQVNDGTGPVTFTFPVHMVACPPVLDQGDTTAAYNSMPFGVENGRAASVGFEANAVNEFGDGVELDADAGSNLDSMKVLFSSYGCETRDAGVCVTTPGATFTHPITANIYAVALDGGVPVPGALLATTTINATLPYRPSADPVNCTGDRWLNTVNGACQLSIQKVVTFPMPSVPLPPEVIWTVAFNTTHHGYSPIGTAATCYGTSGGCPYDSLNVGASTYPGAPYAGIDLEPDIAYDSVGAGPLARDTGWTPYKPLGAVYTQ